MRAGARSGALLQLAMEACVIVCRSVKESARQGRVLFIDAVGEIARERGQCFLRPEHQARILSAYRAFADEPGFTAIVSTTDVLRVDGNLSIARYVKKPKPQVQAGEAVTLPVAWDAFHAEGRDFWIRMDALLDMLDGLRPVEDTDA